MKTTRARDALEPRALERGPRVYLRRPTAADGGELLALNRASRSFHRRFAYPPTRPAEFTAYLARCEREDFAGLAVCRRGDGALLGIVNLSQIFYGGFRSAYMGYYVGAPYAGSGYMTEAVELALRYAFERLRLHRMEANIQPENERSLALVRRLGFSREGYSPRYLKIGGRWRDHERWAILAETWRARRRERAAAR
jgi:ribosomal-protein-alanine N-acetyltransferase